MNRTLARIYGIACYLLFAVTLAYFVGFLANVGVPKSVDADLVNAGAERPLGLALCINGLLMGLFGLQHSGMARTGFKRWWVRLVPRAVERTTYVLASSLVLLFLFWQWQPIPALIWDVAWGPGRWALWGLYGLGWTAAVGSTFLISHADLFGLRQTRAYGRSERPPRPRFQTPGPYRYVRHPLMSGLLVAFWATPRMTTGHALFAAGMTVYVLVGLRFEERDLVRAFGDRYRAYRERVPMLLPRPGRPPEEPARCTPHAPHSRTTSRTSLPHRK